MTLRQLRYIDMTAKCDTLAAAVEAPFMTQPSLTATFREPGQKLGITLFLRSWRGLSFTPAGEEFLSYMHQVLDQMSLVEQHYTGEVRGRHHFCVSSQHYSFAVETFVALLSAYGSSQYEFHMRETETYRTLGDVAKVRSEIDVLYRNQFNTAVLQQNFRGMKLSFTPIYRARPHVFLGTQRPLTKKTEISVEDFRDYPRPPYEQGQYNSFYFSEEIQSAAESDRGIMVRDRATLFNLLIGMNSYTVYSSVINTELNGKNTVTRPLAVDDCIELGYVLPKERPTGDLTLAYIDLLR